MIELTDIQCIVCCELTSSRCSDCSEPVCSETCLEEHVADFHKGEK